MWSRRSCWQRLRDSSPFSRCSRCRGSRPFSLNSRAPPSARRGFGDRAPSFWPVSARSSRITGDGVPCYRLPRLRSWLPGAVRAAGALVRLRDKSVQPTGTRSSRTDVCSDKTATNTHQRVDPYDAKLAGERSVTFGVAFETLYLPRRTIATCRESERKRTKRPFLAAIVVHAATVPDAHQRPRLALVRRMERP